MSGTDVDHRESPLVQPVVSWFAQHARDLPWRRPGVPAWSVLVSEVMLQQTPVARVLPAYQQWLARWPTPSALAHDSPGQALRQWDRLGYPRRALRLHACARQVTQAHAGVVPDDLTALLALPGVGSYTARAVLAFAYQRRAPVVDTNVRRVLARVRDGQAIAGPISTTRDLASMQDVLPLAAPRSAQFCAAVMELGAVVCTAARPACLSCPVAEQCRWRALGYPPPDRPNKAGQSFAGTDRQVRGLLLAALRAEQDAVPRAALDIVWPAAPQRDRALSSLLADGLVVAMPEDRLALPS